MAWRSWSWSRTRHHYHQSSKHKNTNTKNIPTQKSKNEKLHKNTEIFLPKNQKMGNWKGLVCFEEKEKKNLTSKTEYEMKELVDRSSKGQFLASPLLLPILLHFQSHTQNQASLYNTLFWVFKILHFLPPLFSKIQYHSWIVSPKSNPTWNNFC